MNKIITEYKDTFVSFTMAFILLIVLVIGSIPPTVNVSADGSRLSVNATVEVTIQEMKP